MGTILYVLIITTPDLDYLKTLPESEGLSKFALLHSQTDESLIVVLP